MPPKAVFTFASSQVQEQKTIQLPWGSKINGSQAPRQHNPARLSLDSFTQSPYCSQITVLHLGFR